MATKAYREANKDKIKKSAKAYREANAEHGREYQKAYRKTNPDKIREYKKNNLEAFRAKTRRSVASYRLNHPDRVKAVRSVETAISSRRLLTPSRYSCAAPGCYAQASEYHHWSYERIHWICVIPLCCSCHDNIHSGLLVFDNPSSLAVSSVQIAFDF